MIEASSMFAMNSIYLNSAYLGPTPIRSRDRIQQVLERGMDPGSQDILSWYAVHDDVRPRFAKLLPCRPENLAISTSVSELVSHVANGLFMQPDDEVLLMDGDYPSMILPWLVLAESQKFKVKLLDLAAFLSPARLKTYLTPKTKFVGCSHVMFNTGARLPVAELAATVRNNSDALFMADVSQSLGGMSLAPDILQNADILVGVTYKWILGPYGMAFGYFSDRALARVKRTHASWLHSPMSKSHSSLLNYSTDPLPGARRFDRGQTPSFLMCAGLEGSLDLLLEVGLDKIQAHNQALTDLFFEFLPPSYEVAAPRDMRSNIVSIKPTKKTADELRTQLVSRKVAVSLREGYLRLSFHFCNTREQVQQVLEILS